MDQVKLFSSVIRARVRNSRPQTACFPRIGARSANKRSQLQPILALRASIPDDFLHPLLTIALVFRRIRRLRLIALRGRTIAQHAGRAIGYELAPLARSYRVVAFRAGLCRSRTLAVM